MLLLRGFLHEHLPEFDRESKCVMLWIDSPKALLVLPKYFLYFWLYVIAEQSIVDIDRYEYKGDTSVVLGYSEITLLRERESTSLCPSVYCVLVIYGVYMLSNDLVFHSSGGISSSPAAFLVLNFLRTKLSSSCVNCPFWCLVNY